MSQDIEKQMNQVNQKLRSVFEEQDRNQSAIHIQEQAEADFMNGEVETIVCLIEF